MMTTAMITLVMGFLTSFSLNLFHPAPPLDDEFHKYIEGTIKKHFSSVLSSFGSNIEGCPQFILASGDWSHAHPSPYCPHFNVLRPKSLAN